MTSPTYIGLLEALECAAYYEGVSVARGDAASQQAEERAVARATVALKEYAASLEALARLGAMAAQVACDNGGYDGGDLQDDAVKAGVFVPTEVTEPCGEECTCSAYGEFPGTCYRFAPGVQDAMQRLGKGAL